MSVKFILGRGGSGKSTYMLDKIQERVQDNETSPVILLLPEQYTFEMEKRISKLFSGDKKDKYLRARVLSFKTMGNIVFSNVGGLTDVNINSSGKAMITYRAIESASNDLEIFSKSASQSGFVNSISEMISELKAQGKVKVPLICLMTDYGAHRAWICEHVDAYVVAAEHMVDELVAFGVNRDIVYPFGIPVFANFFEPQDEEMLIREMEMDPGIPIVLFMAGSFGVSNIIGLYKKLVNQDVPLQIIVITGRNKKLYEAFEKEIKTSPMKTKLLYFTDEVEKYMHASDLIVTKPGGLTVSEALACNLPMAVFNAIPGQEEDNANFLKANDMGVKIDKNTDFPKFISDLIREKHQLEQMRKSCEKFDKSKSSENIVELMKELIKNNM